MIKKFLAEPPDQYSVVSIVPTAERPYQMTYNLTFDEFYKYIEGLKSDAEFIVSVEPVWITKET
jgi:hypothetical protein